MNRTPQLEDGYLRIATELLLAMAKAGLTARQWAVLMIIARKTYGYGKKVDDIGLSQISALTGIAKPHVSVAIRELVGRRVITRRVGQFGHIMGINKDHSKWTAPSRTAKCISKGDSLNTESVTVTDHVTVTDSVTEIQEWHGLPNQYDRGYQNGKAGVTESGTTIDNPTLNNHQEISSCASQAKRNTKLPGRAIELENRFDAFYAAYPRKKSKQSARKAFAKLNPDEQLMTAILAGIERAMKSAQWRDPQFIPHPATWLNAEGWLDEIVTEYTAAERAVIDAFNDALGEQLGEVSLAIYDESRAAAIRDFETFFQKPGSQERFFPWVRAHVTLPPSVGFDYVISRLGYDKVAGGQHSRKLA